MNKLLEIENEYFLFRLPTSYFIRFEPHPGSENKPHKHLQEQHLSLAKPNYDYRFNVLLDQSFPILDLRTPSNSIVIQESYSSNAINLLFTKGEDAFTHDLMIYFQTTALGKTAIYCKEDPIKQEVAIMMQRTHMPIFKPHLSD